MLGQRLGASLFALAVASASPPVFAGVNRWTSLGPDGGWIGDIAVAPDDPQVLFSIGRRMLFKSTDSGVTWFAPSMELADPLQSVVAASSSVLYVGTRYGVRASTDGGVHWSATSVVATMLGASLGVESLAVDPHDPSTLFAVTLSGGVVARSTDSGTTWTRLGVSGEGVLVIDPRDSRSLYVGSRSGVLKSSDGGETWAATTAWPTPDAVAYLAFDTSSPSLLYALGTSTGQLFTSSDGGLSWTKRGLAGATAFDLDPGRVGCAYAYVPGAGLVATIDFGTTWLPLTQPSVSLSQSRVVGTASRTVFLLTLWDGLLLSLDAGKSWTTPGLAPRALTATAVAVSELGVFVGTDAGFVRSDDGGATWQRGLLETGSPTPLLPWFSVSGFGEVDGVLFAGTPSGIYRSTDAGRAWAPLPGLTYSTSLCVDTSTPGVLYAGTQGLFKSTDGGATWIARDVGLTNQSGSHPKVIELALRPGDNRTLYAGTDGSGVYSSRDAAMSWTALPPPGETPSVIHSIVIDPDSPATVYVGTGFGAYRSTDEGAHWSSASTGMPVDSVGRPAPVFALALDPRNPATLYAGTQAGVLKSIDGARSWAPLNGDLALPPILSLSLDPENLDRLLVGTDGSSVYEIVQVPPEIDDVSPPVAPEGASTAITIAGRNFMPGATVRLGDTVLSEATVVDSTTILATVGPHAGGSVALSVTNRTLQRAELSHAITFAPACRVSNAPALTAPASVPPGPASATATVVQAAGSKYTWQIANGTITGGQGTSTLSFVPGSSGAVVLQVAETTSQGCVGASASAVIPVETSGGVSVDRLVPIVLDVLGRNGARYTSDLVIANRGTTNASVQLVYTAATELGGLGSGIGSLALPAGRQVVLSDVLAYLRDAGLSIPRAASAFPQGGTLRAVFSNVSSADAVFAGVRTTAPALSGHGGLAYPGLSPEETTAGAGYVFGLRETDVERSNLALVNTSPGETCSVRVRVSDGAGATPPVDLGEFDLAPAQWLQLNSVLAGTGFRDGYAHVERVSGTAGFFAYGVVNDNGTNDGTYLRMVPGNASRSVQAVPVVVRTSAFETELVLSNPTAQAVTARLDYAESLGPAASALAEIPLRPGEQRLLPDVLSWLHGSGTWIGPWGSSQAGVLDVTFDAGAAGALLCYAGARTSSAATSGRFGLAYDGATPSEAALSEAWIYGLQQDETVRANLAVANPPFSDGSVSLRYALLDGETGQQVFESEELTLAPGAWKQIDGVLAGRGVRQGYARVWSVGGERPFLAYGVVNDGAAPGLGTGDGTFLQMAVAH